MATSVAEPITANKPAPAAEQVSTDPSTSGTGLYRRIWRWHFYAGLITLPIILLASVTGALWVFHQELEPVFYPELLIVEQQATRASYEEQLAAVRAAIEDREASLTHILAPFDPKRSNRFQVKQGEDYFGIFVNPYTAEILGEQHSSFFDVVLVLHRRLMVGSTGRVLVELATSWGIVLLISGLYLWWPRGREQFWGIWLPRLRTKTYVVWRDLHSVSGFYLIILSLFILLSGLAFSFVVGRSWLMLNMQAGAFPESLFNPAKSASPAEAAAPISVDEAVRIATRHEFEADQINVELPVGEDGAYTVRFGSADYNPPISGQVAVDQYSGEIVSVTSPDDFGLSGKIQFYSVPIHIGSIFGMPTKILAFLTCLGLVFATISGASMWWVRRPQGGTGFPARVNYKIPKWLIAVTVLLGIVMPTVGLSIILILVGEWLYSLWRRFRQPPGLTVK